MIGNIETILVILFLFPYHYNSFVFQHFHKNGWLSALSTNKKQPLSTKLYAEFTKKEDIEKMVRDLDISAFAEPGPDTPEQLKLSRLDEYTPISQQELLVKWKEYCKSVHQIDKSKGPIDWNEFLPHLYANKSNCLSFIDGIPLTSSTESIQEIVSDTTYISEQELERMWKETKESGLDLFSEKAVFDIEQALLLLPDETDTDFIQAADELGQNQIQSLYAKYRDEINHEQQQEEEEVVKSNKPEHIPTTTQSPPTTLSTQPSLHDLEPIVYLPELELKRIWDERAEISFGLPCANYDMLSAFLLLEDDEKDLEDHIRTHASDYPIELLKEYAYFPEVKLMLIKKINDLQVKKHWPERKDFLIPELKQVRPSYSPYLKLLMMFCN